MKIAAASWWISLAALLLLARDACGEGTAYDLRRKDAWQAGDVVTRTSADSERQRIQESKADGTVPKDVTTQRTTTATIVEQVLDADGDGNATKVVVYLKGWAMEKGKERDGSVEGAILDVAGRGKERTWRFRGEPPKASDAARQWLDETYGAGDDEDSFRLAIEPPGPVHVGDAWDTDAGRLFPRSLRKLPIDKSKIVSSCTLVSVDGGLARVKLSIAMPLSAMPAGGDATVPWTKGGVFRIEGEITLALEGRRAVLGKTIRGTLEGEAKIEAKKGPVLIAITREYSGDFKTAAGGEIPAASPKGAADGMDAGK